MRSQKKLPFPGLAACLLCEVSASSRGTTGSYFSLDPAQPALPKENPCRNHGHLHRAQQVNPQPFEQAGGTGLAEGVHSEPGRGWWDTLGSWGTCGVLQRGHVPWKGLTTGRQGRQTLVTRKFCETPSVSGHTHPKRAKDCLSSYSQHIWLMHLRKTQTKDVNKSSDVP